MNFLVVLAKHSRKIIFSTIVVTVLAYLYFVSKPFQYAATARMLPPYQNLTMSGQIMDSLGGGSDAMGRGIGISGGAMASLLGLRSTGTLYVGMMTSDTVCDRIIERFKLRQAFKVKYQEEARKKLKKMAQIISSRDGFIDIKITDTDQERVASMANAFIEELDKLLHGLALQEASKREAFLEKVRAESNENLAKAEKALRNFSEKNSVLQIDAQTASTLRYIADLRATIDTKEVQIQVLRQQATPSNYDVIRMETEIKGMKEKLRAAESQCELTTVGEVCLTSSKVPALGLDYMRLYREVKFQEGLHQLYSKMSEIARLDMIKDVAVVQVVDKAMMPETRCNSRMMPSIFAGITVFFLMIIFSFLWEKYRQLKDREEVVRDLAEVKGYLRPWVDGFVRLKDLVQRQYRRHRRDYRV